MAHPWKCSRPGWTGFGATCAGFGWGGVNFLHNSWQGAVFGICAEHSDDNIELFLLLLSRAHSEPGTVLLLVRPHWRGAGGAWEREGHSQGR